MELMSYLCSDEWKRVVTPHPSKLQSSGFREYRIGHRQKLGAGQFQYMVSQIQEEDAPALLQISGASGEMDPLKEIQRVNLKVDPSSGAITGIITDEECVVRKN